MAIVENKASEVGDVILIKAEVPVVGLVTLASFSDSVVNETGAKFFTKEFRYSTDGINYTPWEPLTNQNISAINVQPTNTFFAEYRYTRSGTDSSLPELEFNEVELTGDFQSMPCGDAYDNSIFSQFFTCTDICVLSWMINVLEKVYKTGIIPEYIERGAEGNEFNEDQDYLEFWKSICQFFAYIVCYARKWELSNVTTNYDLLFEYLQNQTFILCGQESIQDLLYVMNNSYDEFRHRGTFEIIKTKSGDGRDVDGEWHRLFCNLGKCTDWYFSSVFNYSIGWVGDKASPLYKGNYFDPQLTKGYEAEQAVQSLSNYPLINPGNIGIVSDVDNSGQGVDVISINQVPGGGTISGIGHTTPQVDTEQLFPVSKKSEYEITFWIKLQTTPANLTFRVNCYDSGGNLLDPPGTRSAWSSVTNNTFLQNFGAVGTGNWYFVRGIIYSKEYYIKPGESIEDYYVSGLKDSSKPTSTQLKFDKDKDVCFISPTIVLENNALNTVSGEMRLYDIKVRPLRTFYSTGLEQVSNFIKMKVENFNQNLSNSKAEEILREFLIPYNSTYKMQFLNQCEETSMDNVLDIITQGDVRWLSPSTSNVSTGDRYLVYDGSTLQLYEYSGGWNLSPDNTVGGEVYVVSNRAVFSYNDSKWNFSCK